MRTSQTKSPWQRPVLALLLGAIALVGCAGLSARAADEQEEYELPDTKIMKGVLRALGLGRDGTEIEYRERAPLVLPTGKDLPPPEANNPAAKTANWPVDADITRAKKRKTERKYSNPEPEDARPLLPNQYNRPGSGSPTNRPNGPSRTAEDSERPMSPGELGSKSIFSLNSWWSPKEEYATFSSEPPRESLTEPPAGYRTPSPNQPYGIGKESWQPQADTVEQKHLEQGRSQGQ